MRFRQFDALSTRGCPLTARLSPPTGTTELAGAKSRPASHEAAAAAWSAAGGASAASQVAGRVAADPHDRHGDERAGHRGRAPSEAFSAEVHTSKFA